MDIPNWTTIYLLYYTDTISNKKKNYSSLIVNNSSLIMRIYEP